MNAKRVIAWAIVLSLVIASVACSDNGANNTMFPPNTGVVTGNNSEPSLTPGGDNRTIIPTMNPPMPWPEYPIIDGSSSTVMMHAAIRAYLTDEFFVDSHSQTYAALERIIPGSNNPADVILAVKYYDDTLRDVIDRGTDLVITPIAKEGFVFIVHGDNPVDSLSQQQLKDIYSGKIANWKEVGGKDEKIIVVQRNMDSGSQTAMTDFMGGVPLASDDDVMYMGSMGDMLAAVMINGSAAIGYNIYSWSMKEITDQNVLKMVVVDGVKPSDATLADGSYPLLIYTYSYYNQGNTNGQNLTDWLLTDEGQKVIASAGYVGIFGEVNTRLPVNYNKDAREAETTLFRFYDEHGWDLARVYHSAARLPDKAQTETLANGKAKDVTVLYLFYYDSKPDGTEYKITRFIVLTRAKGRLFEVINEGEVLSYEEGIIIPGDVENHRPPNN